ncbi:MAG: hypothetical protein IJ068_03420 [Bacilli bacterium]|nr:hypothetical protein [Bacilli bacterium]
MKTIKLENRITYFLLIFSLFLLNYHSINIFSIIFASIITIPTIKLFEKINIYKYKLTRIILLIISCPLLSFYLNKVTYFISDNILRDYSGLVIAFTLLLSIFILGNKGYHTIIKVIIINCYFIFFITLIGLFILIPYINIQNINLSILNNNNLFNSSVTYIFYLIYSYFLIYSTTNTKFKNKDLIISSSFNIFYILLINSVLSIITNYVKYPYIAIFKKVNLIGFIDRIEIIFSMNNLFIFYFLLLLIYYQIYYILKNKLKSKQLNITLSIISILVFLFSLI